MLLCHAGTGKSLVLRELIRRLKAAGRSTELAVTASTGIAAVGLGAGGQTLHSWAGIGIGNDFNADTLAKRLSRKAKDRWIRTEILVIDEISMLDAQLFELLEHVGRLVRNRPDAPFGGIQLILCGDFFQLPPVGQSVRFCFEAHCWSRCVDLIVVLKRVFRQAGDQTFVNILGEARCGRLSQQSIALLKSRLNAKFDPKDDIEPTILFPYKKDVDTTNATRLLQLDASTHSVYLSDDTREGAQPADATAKAYLARLCAAPERLELRIGAQVILLKNMNQVPLLKSRATVSLMNGERGTVVDFIQPQGNVIFSVLPFNVFIVSFSMWSQTRFANYRL
jgi:ATP-dependent DNA helicase PIF1